MQPVEVCRIDNILGYWELGMSNHPAKPTKWSKPELKRLGKIQDVGGAQGAGTQAAGVKT